MGRQHDLFVPEELAGALAHEPWADLYAQAMERASHQFSPRTLQTYQQSLDAWRAWCATYREPTMLPIDPRAFVSYLEWCVNRGYQRATIELRIASLSRVDEKFRETTAQGVSDTLNRHPVVRAWLRAYKREHPAHSPNAAPYVERAELETIVSTMYEGRTTPARIVARARDRAILTLGYTGAFRRGELSRVRLGDIEQVPRGLFVRWARSKGDQQGIGAERLLMRQPELLLCPVDAWTEWLAIYQTAERWECTQACEPDAPAFPALHGHRVKGHAITEQDLYRTIKRRGDAAGIPITPHSLRSAFATWAAEIHDEATIAHHGRWQSRTSMARYVRRGAAHKNNPTKNLSKRTAEQDE